MPRDWQKVLEILERENDRLDREARRLRRDRDVVLHEARMAFGRTILPNEEIAELPEDPAAYEEAERALWFPEDEYRAKYEAARREVDILEPTLEQLRYWGDIRDDRDCLVRRVAAQALDLLRDLREKRDAEDSGTAEGSPDWAAAHRPVG